MDVWNLFVFPENIILFNNFFGIISHASPESGAEMMAGRDASHESSQIAGFFPDDVSDPSRK